MISDMCLTYGDMNRFITSAEYLFGIIAEKKYEPKVRRTLTLCILMDFPIPIGTISMGLPIVYFKGSQVEFSKLGCISDPSSQLPGKGPTDVDDASVPAC